MREASFQAGAIDFSTNSAIGVHGGGRRVRKRSDRGGSVGDLRRRPRLPARGSANSSSTSVRSVTGSVQRSRQPFSESERIEAVHSGVSRRRSAEDALGCGALCAGSPREPSAPGDTSSCRPPGRATARRAMRGSTPLHAVASREHDVIGPPALAGFLRHLSPGAARPRAADPGGEGRCSEERWSSLSHDDDPVAVAAPG